MEEKDLNKDLKNLKANIAGGFNGQKDSFICPHCGRCPTCGRPYHYNYPQNPYYPAYPQVWC